ncbi:MAG: flippase-like domain-containing protein [Magnetococcales bacterium]|nr:flippase-like domain-containing protein [Magnetococcales bacterium]
MGKKTVGSGVMLLLMGWVFHRHGSEFAGALEVLSLSDLLPLMAAQVVMIALTGHPFKTLCACHEAHLHFKEWVGLSYAGNLANYIAPLRPGLAVRFLYMNRRFGMSLSRMVVVTGAYTLLMFGVSVGIVVATQPFLPFSESLPGLEISLGIVTLSVVGSIMAPRICRLGWIQGHDRLRGLCQAFLDLLTRPGVLVGALLVFILINVMSAVTYYFAFLALGSSPPPLLLLFLVAVATIASWMAITPGNIGVTESLVGLILEMAAGDFATGFLATAVVRAGHVSVSILFGGPSLYYIMGRIATKQAVSPGGDQEGRA